MNLSENHLFHFTNELALTSIINDGFIPFFGLEYTELDDNSPNPIRIEKFPRVCFTDLPLSHISKHTEKYDRFAIGMNKEWAIRNGANPVLYIQKNSLVGATLSMQVENLLAFHKTLRDENVKSNKLEYILQNLNKLNHMIGRYTKPFELTEEKVLSTHGKVFKIKADRFYDEREWRFVPFIDIDELIREKAWPFTEANDEDLLRVSKNHILQFDLKDIVSIVVPKETEIVKIVNLLSTRYKVERETVSSSVEFIVI